MTLPYNVSAEDVIVNRIRSRMGTLDRYRKTSTAAHGRLTPSVVVYAAAVGNEVRELAGDYPEYAQVQRWAQKFEEYVTQYGLVNGGV